MILTFFFHFSPSFFTAIHQLSRISDHKTDHSPSKTPIRPPPKMSISHRSTLPQRVLRPLTPETSSSDSATTSLDDGIYKYTCGAPDASETWICCDNDDCPVRWYHWKCVRVTQEPRGDWFCPSCRPDSTADEKVVGKTQGGEAVMFSKLDKTGSEDHKDILRHQKKGKRSTAEKKIRAAKKGIAIKKTPPKKKSTWVGWVDVDSEDEDQRREGKRSGVQISVQKAGMAADAKRERAHAAFSKGKNT